MTPEIRREYAVAEIKSTNPQSEKFDEIESQRIYQQLEDQKINIKLNFKERSDIIEMRGSWSKCILGAILAVIGVDIIVIFLVGFHYMVFSDVYTLPVFIGESLLKTLGLAFIIVNFLFGKNSLGNNRNISSQ